MIIKYEYIGDRAVVYIPDDAQWEIITRSVDEKGYEDNGLYLIVNGEERSLSDAEAMCAGRSLPEYEIGALHGDVVDAVFRRMADDPQLRAIDIEEIIAELLTSKYEKRWAEKGYIELRADGSW